MQTLSNRKRNTSWNSLARRGGARSRARQKGNAVVEMALMAPWLFLLFMGVFDFGFYAYAAISTQQAARVAALYTSSSQSNVTDSSGACRYVLSELKDLPNMTNVATCAANPAQITSSQPVAVVPTSVTGADSAPAAQVSVTYQTVPVFPIPGLMGQMTITRTAQMRVP